MTCSAWVSPEEGCADRGRQLELAGPERAAGVDGAAGRQLGDPAHPHPTRVRESNGEPQVGYLELLRTNANVRRIWGGAIVSNFGDWFNTLALYRVVLDLSGSEMALGAVFLTKLLPLALASPLAGVIVDRVNRKRLMIGSDLVRAVIVLGFLFIDDASDLWLLYVLAAAQIVVSSVFIPAKNAVLPNIASPRELLTANALLSATWSVMLAVGAAAGGFAVDAFGVEAVFIFDAGTYLLSAVILARLTVPPRVPEAATGSVVGAAARQIAAGWRYLQRRPEVGRMAFAKATWGLGGGGLVLALTLVGDQLFPGGSTAGIGILFAARGAGTGLGPILGRALFRDERQWPVVLGVCVMLSGLGYVAIALLSSWAALVVGLVVMAHAASGANWVFSTTLLQQRAEDTYRGRVFATDWLMVTIVESVSILVASALLERGMALEWVILGLAGTQVVSGLIWMMTVVPAERRREALA
ncbi:MAG: MFS transporter [Bacteroidota bacterium]